jgi:drug/metabolite transporter (DMT)-like permease
MSEEPLSASARTQGSGRRGLSALRTAAGDLSAPVRGAIYMTAASLGFAAMNVLVREASHELEPVQVAFFRNLFAALFMLPWLMRMGVRHSLPTANLKLHLLRAAIGLCGMLAWFYSVALLPLAQAVALNFTVPLFATIGAALILGEIVRARRWSATLVGFLGVLIILRPGTGDVTLTTLLPVLAAVFMACSIMVVKTLSGRDSPGAIVLWANLLLTPLSLIPALFVWRWPSLEVWLLLAGIGACAVIAHIWLTRAYARADASAVLPFDYTRLPFIALFAFLLYGEVPDVWTWVGAAVIAASTFYIARREAQVARAGAAADAVGPAGRL